MRILLTNNTLDKRAGTELYVLDVARELKKRGHQPVAFSQQTGEVAASLRESGIPVVDDPARMGAPPDVIHGHHHIETLIALMSFPGVPAISFCHGWSPWQEEPLRFPRIQRYVAVDQPCWERLVLESGIPSAKVERLFNFVDMRRFRSRPGLPEVPRRALALGNYFLPGPALELMQQACRDLGIELHVAGLSSGNPNPAPEDLLPGYDLVFAKARAALEAMAVGTAVILYGPSGLGPMVAPENWRKLRELNFGFRCTDLGYTADAIKQQIRRYNAAAATQVRDLTRGEATLSAAVDRLCALYEDVVREAGAMRLDTAAEHAAASQYLLSWAPRYKKWESAGLASRLALEVEQVRRDSEAREREVQEQLAVLTVDRDRWRYDYDAVTSSATWRLANLGLRNRVTRSVGYPIVERMGRFLRRILPSPDKHSPPADAVTRSPPA